MSADVLTLERPLGEGSVGQVFLARTGEGRAVALKILTVHSSTQKRLFEEEVRVLSKLKHPGLVEVLGFSSEPSPRFWMDYVDGKPIDEAALSVSPEKIADWLTAALEALAYLHGQTVAHGDLKPANLLIDSDGNLKLLDFGLSALRREQAAGPQEILGSIPYLAPEAVDGDPGPSSDLFALGTVFYELLAGAHPRDGARNLAELFAAPRRSLESLNRPLPPRTARVIDRMIEADPAKRLNSASEALAALRGQKETKAAGKPLQTFRLIEREEAWNAAVDFAERLKAEGRPGAIVVRGEPGTGKTRLVKELNVEFAVRGFSTETGELEPGHLHALLNTPGSRTLALIEAGDTEDPGGDFSELLRHPQVLDLKLLPFSEAGARAYLESLSGRNWPQSELREAFDLTGGNPKLLAALLVSGAKGSATFEDVYAAAFAKLSPSDRRILELTAAGGAASLWDLSELAGLSFAETRAAALRLAGANLAKREGDDLLHLAHPALAAILLKTLTGKEKRRLHEDWLRLLETRESGDADVEVAVARHRIALPFTEKTVPGVLKAAAHLKSVGRLRELVDLLEAAVAASPASESRELLRALANAYARRGLFRQAIETGETWFQSLGGGASTLDTVKFWLGTGIHAKNLGERADARRRFEKCLSAASGDPAERPFLARAHSVLGLIDLEEEGFSEARSHFAAVLELTPEDGEERAELYRNLALLELREGRIEAAQASFEDARRLYAAADNVRGLFSISLERGNDAVLRGRWADARLAFQEALSLADGKGLEDLRARALMNLGSLALREWNFPEALRQLNEARELFAFFGSPADRALNLYQLAAVHAELGFFEKAREFLQRGDDQKSPEAASGSRRAEIEARLRHLETGEGPSGNAETATAQILKKTHDALPQSLQISFEDRSDYQRLVLNQEEKPMAPNAPYERLNAVIRDLLGSDDMETVLVRILDAAMDISRAERGFLMIRDEDADGPVPGFDVKVARNLSKDKVGEDRSLSLSAVREAMATGAAVVTDNAVQDGRFKNAPSVQQGQLLAILALPLKDAGGVSGVLYLDHRYQPLIFRGDDLSLLQMFADQAALALQKARMIGQLKAANKQLAATVDDQTSRITLLEREVVSQRRELKREYGEIVGESRPMLEVLELVDRLVDTSVPVWIFGESGTGKESIARALHFQGPRAKKPFVSENCSSLPETLLESELFGHKKGSFTHADRDKKGLLHYADGGTVFLDEIADMSPALQAKLLRFLQEGEIRPVGSNEVVRVDVRVVSASNKDLQDLIAQGKFREDLFYRLNGVTIALPPLRDRLDDIPLLVRHFLKKAAEKEKKDPVEITGEALEILLNYNWPGNVRELENTVRTASVFHQRGKITPKSFAFKKELAGAPVRAASSINASGKPGKTASLTEGKRLVIQALYDNGYQKLQAAKALGISRRHLYTQMVRYRIPVERLEMQGYIERELGLRK